MDYKSFLQALHNLPAINLCISYETDKASLSKPENATGRPVWNSSRREWVQDALWVCPQDIPIISLANYQLPVVLFLLHYYPISIYLAVTLCTNATKNLLFSAKIYLVCRHLVGLLSFANSLPHDHIFCLSIENPVVAQLFGKFPTFNLTQWSITVFKKPILVRNYSRIRMIQKPIPVTARSKAWICSRLLAGIVGSKPAGGMGACFSRVLCVGR